MEINSPEIDRDRNLTEDEFWTERRRLETEGFGLVATYDISTNTGCLNHESHIRSLVSRGIEFRILRKPNGDIQILKRERQPNESEKTTAIQQAARDEIGLRLAI